jgi:hypothetical protein
MSYTVAGLPVRGYRCTVELAPHGVGTEIRWSGRFTAPRLLAPPLRALLRRTVTRFANAAAAAASPPLDLDVQEGAAQAVRPTRDLHRVLPGRAPLSTRTWASTPPPPAGKGCHAAAGAVETHTAIPGSESHEKLQLLSVIGPSRSSNPRSPDDAGRRAYQARGWASRKKPPVGPSAGSVAAQTTPAALSTTGRAPMASAPG